MLFNSFEFLFVYLPVTLIGYFIVGALIKAPVVRVAWLGAASLAFYTYWEPRFLPIVCVSIAFNYVGGRLIEAASDRRRFLMFIGVVATNLVALCYFKYFNFFLSIAGGLLHIDLGKHSILLPLGISFFTFTQIAYLADIYSGYKSEKSIFKYILFVSYFPHLIAGPILHHKEMMWQFGCEERRRFSLDRFAVGLGAFSMGLFKKAVIADSFATLADPVFLAAGGGVPHSVDAWIGALAYSLQIYFDFSGYSDMAVGLSTMFGITLPFNFDSPYKSRSIVEFWRRWHITLSRFLRDYLYISLGGSRRGEIRRYVNLALTMVLGGLWHGAGWTFVIWGALHGVFLAINHLWIKVRKSVPVLQGAANTVMFSLLSLGLTQFLVVIAWVYFRADRMKVAERILSSMFGVQAATVAPAFAQPLMMAAPVIAGYLWCFVMPNVNEIFQGRDLGLDTYNTPGRWSFPVRWRPTWYWGLFLGLITVVGFLAIIKSGRGSPFLYFQF